MRVLVCGGRDFMDKEFAFSTLDAIDAERRIEFVIHGGQTGADYLGLRWGEMRKCPTHEYRADWNKHGRAAGPIRNQAMIDHGKPHLVVAFKGGRGTADMIRRARAAGIDVFTPSPALSGGSD